MYMCEFIVGLLCVVVLLVILFDEIIYTFSHDNKIFIIYLSVKSLLFCFVVVYYYYLLNISHLQHIINILHVF